MLVGVACSGATVSEQLLGPTTIKCQPTLTGIPATMGSAGGQIVARVLTTADCVWSATTDASWLVPQPANGQGEGALTIYVAENPASAGRTGTVDLNGVVQQVTQEAAPPPVEPDPDEEPEPVPAPSPGPAPVPPPPSPPAPDPAPSDITLAGRVSGVSGACPVLRFSLLGFSVDADEKTQFTRGPCRRLADGEDVEITGTLRPNGTVYAARVELKGN